MYTGFDYLFLGLHAICETGAAKGWWKQAGAKIQIFLD
jgi:hypothetical protein